MGFGHCKRAWAKGSCFFQSCSVCAIYYHMHKGTLKVPLEGKNVPLPAMPLLGIYELPYMKLYQNLLSSNISQFSNIQGADWLLFNYFDKLENEEPLLIRVLHTC